MIAAERLWRRYGETIAVRDLYLNRLFTSSQFTTFHHAAM